jgi:hypothetical protein
MSDVRNYDSFARYRNIVMSVVRFQKESWPKDVVAREVDSLSLHYERARADRVVSERVSHIQNETIAIFIQLLLECAAV